MPRFRIGAIVKSSNKPSKGANVWVDAKDKEEAEGKGKRKIQKENPNGHVEVAKVEEVTPSPEPPKFRWW
ncbi:hypothetical protein [Streptomyces acidiscabies]|uniref:hypothetical protein n=1 Tax=Streptomyces acidiscabies TaxID=42234 RepID=UPI00131BB943|nr:hypothetical protein [Streptomyces acidiscabies]